MAQAHGNGEIGDLHAHYIEVGFLEGRLGTIPKVDAEYYLNTYPDVSQAIASGQVGSAEEHYIHRGVTEGRSPSPIAEPAVVRWMTVLRPDG